MRNHDHGVRLFAAARAATRWARTTWRTGRALELSTHGEGKGRHDASHFLAFALRTGNLLWGIEDEFFKLV